MTCLDLAIITLDGKKQWDYYRSTILEILGRRLLDSRGSSDSSQEGKC